MLAILSMCYFRIVKECLLLEGGIESNRKEAFYNNVLKNLVFQFLTTRRIVLPVREGRVIDYIGECS